MRIVVTGASGNVGTCVLAALAGDPTGHELVGIARRPPSSSPHRERVTWHALDVADAGADLASVFRGADAVIHLAWAIQPSHDEGVLYRINVDGSARVFRAAAQARVGAIVYASSVGAYSPGPKDRTVDESWPTNGIGTSFYSRHKAYTERLLDILERDHPQMRVVRLRPALIFQHEAASEIRRLFMGPFLPNPLVRRALIPVVPDVPGLRFQTVHTDDVAEAYRLAATSDARGAFNVAAEPVLDPQVLGQVLGARPVRVPAAVLRGGASLTWRLHLQPTSPGWIDMALQTPLLDSSRVRQELGWAPRSDATEALLDLLAGVRDGAGGPTPALARDAGGPARVGEIVSGVGSRQ